MTKIKRTLLFAAGILVICSVTTLFIIMDITESSAQLRGNFRIIWASSFLPIAVSAFVSAFLYHYLCESEKRWVHVLWFAINTAFVVAFLAIILRLLLVALGS